MFEKNAFKIYINIYLRLFAGQQARGAGQRQFQASTAFTRPPNLHEDSGHVPAPGIGSEISNLNIIILSQTIT
jgi:hypothetical protein